MTAPDPGEMSGGDGGRQEHGKRAASPGRALDLQPPLMPVEDVLDDGKAEPGAAALAAALDVDAIESLGQPRNCLARDAFALILDGDKDLARPPAGSPIRRVRS